MFDVLVCFLFGQRLEVVAPGNSLCELTQVVARQEFAQFRLAYQDNLQQFLLGCLEVGQQPNLFQHIGRKILRLVDDENGPSAVCMGSEQIAVECVDERLDAVALLGYRNM